MTELSAEHKKLLAQLRDVNDPTPAERASGDAAVRSMLIKQGLRNLPALVPKPATQTVAARSGAAVKLAWFVGAAMLASMGLVGVEAWRSSDRAASSTREVSAPASSGASSRALQPQAAVSSGSAAPMLVPPSSSQTPQKVLAHPHRRADMPTHDSLGRELRFLSSVDAEIRAGAYDRALRRLQQHKGTPALQEERAAMRVLALCGRDADSNAQREREQFLEVSPSSVLAARVRGACAEIASP